MKNIYITLILALLAGPQFAQTPIVVSYGPSYSQHDFYRLSDDQIVSVTNTDWEIAFLNAQGQFGPELAIHINEATRSNGTDVELYLSPSNDFNDPISPDDLVIRLFNPDTSWTTGGFNAFRDPTNPFDFGWGLYDASEHAVIGYEVFVVKLRDGSFRKIEIQEFRGTTFQFRWANLDGSNEKTQSLDLSDYPDSELILFSLRDESVAASPSGYDMVFTRYYHPLDDGNGGFLDYAVTGILQGINVAVAKAVGVDPETVSFEDYRDSLDYHSDVIGFDSHTLFGA